MNRLPLDFKKGSLFLIIDGNAVVHRAFHALPPLTNKKGEPVGAVYGFLRVLFRMIREYDPAYLAITFDAPGPTFRHQIFTEYKATRPKAPEELYRQIPVIKQILERMDIGREEMVGFEADDLIGTLVTRYPQIEKMVATGDADLLQLVDDQTKVILFQRGLSHRMMGATEVSEVYEGLSPGQLADLKGLEGDSSDNLPGVPGVGRKTGRNLLLEFGNLEGIYANLSDLPPALAEKMKRFREQAEISRQLGRVRRDVPLDGSLEKYRQKGYNKKEAESFLIEAGLEGLAKDLP